MGEQKNLLPAEGKDVSRYCLTRIQPPVRISLMSHTLRNLRDDRTFMSPTLSDLTTF